MLPDQYKGIYIETCFERKCIIPHFYVYAVISAGSILIAHLPLRMYPTTSRRFASTNCTTLHSLSYTHVWNLLFISVFPTEIMSGSILLNSGCKVAIPMLSNIQSTLAFPLLLRKCIITRVAFTKPCVELATTNKVRICLTACLLPCKYQIVLTRALWVIIIMKPAGGKCYAVRNMKSFAPNK